MNICAVPTGMTPGGIALAFLEFSTVILFLIGGIYFSLIAKKGSNNKKAFIFAVIGTALCFIGGLPNAMDKLSWAIFQRDLIFNSTWMFAGVGPGYICLFLGILFYSKSEDKKVVLKSLAPLLLILLAATVPGFHKIMKYITMLMAAVGMLGFYIHMIRTSKKIIGKYWIFYLIAIIMTSFLVVFSAKGSFNSLWPNILAQTCNNISYVGFILANAKWLKKLGK